MERSDFGPGLAGESAFMLITNSVYCEHCKESPALIVLDFDIFATLEQIPLCLTCLPIVKGELENTLYLINQLGVVGFNGWGRN